MKQRDLKAHGSYLTKDTILEVYDAMAKATETGEPYQTVLDPPPARALAIRSVLELLPPKASDEGAPLGSGEG